MFRYSAEMIEFLRANKGSMSMRELTQKFNDTFGQEKSLGAIHRVCFGNGICPKACYNNELIAFIKKNISKMSYRALTDVINKKFKLNKTIKQIRAFCIYHRIYNGKGKKKSEHFVFTNEMIYFIKEHAQHMNRSKLTCLFNKHFGKNISLSILTNKCHKIGLTHIYPDTKEINSECKNKRDGYFIKTKDGWIPKQRFLWAQKNGPIPQNCCVIFADGDNTNFDEDNLILVNRKEHFRLNKNKFRFNNPDYTKVGLNIVKLSLEVEKREKEVES